MMISNFIEIWLNELATSDLASGDNVHVDITSLHTRSICDAQA